MKVKFVPQNLEFEIKPGESVLHVAQDNGVYIKSVCKGVPSCAECRVRVVEGDHNVMPPGSEELSLIGTGHFIDRRRLSCQLKCFGDITVDMTEQIAKEQGLITGRKKKLSVKDDRVEAVVRRGDSESQAGEESSGADAVGSSTDPESQANSADQEVRRSNSDRQQRSSRDERSGGARGDRDGGRGQRPRGPGGQGRDPRRDQSRDQSRDQVRSENRGGSAGGSERGDRGLQRAQGGGHGGDLRGAQQARPQQPPRLGPDGQPLPQEAREGGARKRRRRRGKGGGGGQGGGGPVGGGAGGPTSDA